MSDEDPIPPCAGVVVVRLVAREHECLLVQTHEGQWGFPKGKRSRGESVIQNALRELHEETGLQPDQIALRDDLRADEFSTRGQLAVRYLAAMLRDPTPLLVLAPQEHRAIGWIPVHEALTWLRPSRRSVLLTMLEGLGILSSPRSQ